MGFSWLRKKSPRIVENLYLLYLFFCGSIHSVLHVLNIIHQKSGEPKVFFARSISYCKYTYTSLLTHANAHELL